MYLNFLEIAKSSTFDNTDYYFHIIYYILLLLLITQNMIFTEQYIKHIQNI